MSETAEELDLEAIKQRAEAADKRFPNLHLINMPLWSMGEIVGNYLDVTFGDTEEGSSRHSLLDTDQPEAATHIFECWQNVPRLVAEVERLREEGKKLKRESYLVKNLLIVAEEGLELVVKQGGKKIAYEYLQMLKSAKAIHGYEVKWRRTEDNVG